MLFLQKNMQTSMLLLIALSLTSHIKLAAQSIPSTADVSRIETFEPATDVAWQSPKTNIPTLDPKLAIPEDADSIRFQLEAVLVAGVSAFTEKELRDIWTPYLGEETSLRTIWSMAQTITERYHAKGFFLSRAVVPAQTIENGTVKIEVTEGYIDKVLFTEDRRYLAPLQRWANRITADRPITADALESLVLSMNDLPGIQYRTLLEKSEDGKPGSVQLLLKPEDEPSRLYWNFDNYGSEFLGPYRMSVLFEKSWLPYHKTVFSSTVSMPIEELRQFSVSHTTALTPYLALAVSGSHTVSRPGGALEPFDIKTQSNSLQAGIDYQPIRQRNTNLTLSAHLTGKNTSGNAFENPLTRDRIRAIRLKLDYSRFDDWQGYNSVRLQLRQGLSFMGGSKPGDENLSRDEAEPDFTALRFNYARYHMLSAHWIAIGKLSGQYSPAPLYSAEEFGVGGSQYGRAYDSSELLGDNGFAGSLEIRYQHLGPWLTITCTPYVFYELGKVWDVDSQGTAESAASAGYGFKLKHRDNISADMGIAWPLTRPVEEPLYGGNKDPRFLLQATWEF